MLLYLSINKCITPFAIKGYYCISTPYNNNAENWQKVGFVVCNTILFLLLFIFVVRKVKVSLY